eukprot:c8924_g1_i1.p1 GENE.c8924_g1_i1~~c8924_g1_i1.p1  ORF type:complete len:426 (-),score=70.89 c8924_g1_i1:65-1246(-)
MAYLTFTRYSSSSTCSQTKPFCQLAPSRPAHGVHISTTFPPHAAASVSEAIDSHDEAVPSKRQIHIFMLNRAVPMVGFGFMDNVIMIQAGELIDSTMGVTFGLSTITAAAMGQLCSDFSGVCFGGGIEALATRIGLPHSRLTCEQLKLKKIRRLGVMSAAVGVVIGCSLGMTTLLFIDADKPERMKRQKAMKTTFGETLHQTQVALEADRAVLWLYDAKTKCVWCPTPEVLHDELVDVYLQIDQDTTRTKVSEELLWDATQLLGWNVSRTTVSNWVRNINLSAHGAKNAATFRKHVKEVLENEEFQVRIKSDTFLSQVLDKGDVINSNQTDQIFSHSQLKSLLMVPVRHPTTQRIVGAVEVRNKNTRETFDDSDVKALLLQCASVGTFLSQCF